MQEALQHSNLRAVLDFYIQRRSRFTTSANVVMKASGLRFEAIRAIAREQGVEIKDTESRCIDENLLSELADAHVRQLKNYFNNCKRHYAELSGAELSVFNDFVNNFKKHPLHLATLSWNLIDTDAIREQFIKKVHNTTQQQELVSLFGCKPSINISDKFFSLELDSSTKEYHYKKVNHTIDRVLKSSWLYCKEPTKEYVNNEDFRYNASRITISARYYTYPTEDDHIAC